MTRFTAPEKRKNTGFTQPLARMVEQLGSSQMVKILSDNPSGEDLFSSGSSGLGPHERIAASLERRILSDEGGGAIGLQGTGDRQ